MYSNEIILKFIQCIVIKKNKLFALRIASPVIFNIVKSLRLLNDWIFYTMIHK